MDPRISAPDIRRDANGAPWSESYGDIYASRDGAGAQARHVFLHGNGLPERWQNRSQFVILENGFGLGTNFLSTLKLWREDPQRSEKLCFVSIEKHPAEAAELLEFADSSLVEEARELSEKWPVRTPGVHQIFFDGGRVELTLYFMDASVAAKRLSLGFDALYLDGFSPKVNSEMWEPALLKALCRHARREATLATWCVASSVRGALLAAGFEVEKKQGFGHKAQMTVGHFAPRFKARRSLPPPEAKCKEDDRSALVIGAGLSGAAVTAELSRRGWKVTVVDAGRVAASEASAIRWGMLHAQLSADDNQLSRITRAGIEAARHAFAGREEYFKGEGLFQMAKDEAEWERWKKWQESGMPFPLNADFIELIDAEEAGRRVGMPVVRGGFWHVGAGLVNSSPWVRMRLYESGAIVIPYTRVEKLLNCDGRWTAYAADGSVIAEAAVCVVAAAADSERLLGTDFGIREWRGRVSLLQDTDLPNLKGGITGRGYAIRSDDGWVTCGASYEEEGEVVKEAETVHRDNLAKLSRFFPDLKEATAMGFYDGYRAVAPDRLPIVGEAVKVEDGVASRVRGLYCAFAMASRAITLCDLSARIIAARIEGEPLPVETDLADALDPARFFKTLS